MAHDITQRMIENWPQERPVGVQRAHAASNRRADRDCAAPACPPDEYIDDLVYFPGGNRQHAHHENGGPGRFELLPKFRRARRRLGELYRQILDAHRPELRAGQRPDFVDDLLEMNRTDPSVASGNGPACEHPCSLHGRYRYVCKRLRVHALRALEASGSAGADESGSRRDVRKRAADAGRIAQTRHHKPNCAGDVCACIRSSPAPDTHHIQLVRIRRIPGPPPGAQGHARHDRQPSTAGVLSRSGPASISNVIRRTRCSTGSPARSHRFGVGRHRCIGSGFLGNADRAHPWR